MSVVEQVLPHLIHVGAILYLICFLFRNQIYLRCFAILGDVAYTLYYYSAAEKPLWEAIFWIIPNMGINIVMIFIILRDQRMTVLSDDELSLFRSFAGLTPGQFRRLMKQANWHRPTDTMRLTEEGKPLGTLYYVLDGRPEIMKGDRVFTSDPSVFIGELAYLRNKPATATVTVPPGATLVSWSHKDLSSLTDKDGSLGQALAALLSSDLAEKVARS